MVTVEQLEKKSPNHRKHLILSHFLTLGLQPNNLNDLQKCFDSLSMEVWLYMLQYQLIPGKLLLQYVTRQVLSSYPLYIQYLSLDMILIEMNKIEISSLTWVYLHKTFQLEITDVSGDLAPLLNYLESISQVKLSDRTQKSICQFYVQQKEPVPFVIYKHLSVMSLFPMLNKDCLLSYQNDKSLDLQMYPSPLIYASSLSELNSMLNVCNVKHIFDKKSILEMRSWTNAELECLFQHNLPHPNDPFYSAELLQNVSLLPNKSYDYYYELSKFEIDLRPLLKDKNIVHHEKLSMQVLLFIDKMDVTTLTATEQYTIANMKHFDSSIFLSILQKLTIRTTMSIINNIPLLPLKPDMTLDDQIILNIQQALAFSTSDKNEQKMSFDDLEFGMTPLHALFKRYASYEQQHHGTKNKLHLLLKMKSMQSSPVLVSEYPVAIGNVLRMMEVYIFKIDKMNAKWNIADKSGHYPLCCIKDVEIGISGGISFEGHGRVDLEEFKKDKMCMNCGEVTHDHNNNCPICRDVMTNKHTLGCGHEYCVDCIKEWLQTQQCCPYCRRKATLEELQE